MLSQSLYKPKTKSQKVLNSKILDINQTTISHQLKTLKDQGLVEYKREGKILVYRLKSPHINEMITTANITSTMYYLK